jgi:hypothetical protein
MSATLVMGFVIEWMRKIVSGSIGAALSTHR